MKRQHLTPDHFNSVQLARQKLGPAFKSLSDVIVHERFVSLPSDQRTNPISIKQSLQTALLSLQAADRCEVKKTIAAEAELIGLFDEIIRAMNSIRPMPQGGGES